MDAQNDIKQQKLKIKLGDLLIKAKLLTPEEVYSALEVQKKSGEKLGRILVSTGIITEKQLCETLGYQLGMPFIDLERIALDPVVVSIIPESIAIKHTIIAVEKSSEGILSVAMFNPLDVVAIDDVRVMTGLEVKVMVSNQSAIEKAINTYYKIDGLIFDTLQEVSSAEPIEIRKERYEDSGNATDILEKSKQPPIVRLLDFLMTDAVKRNASDIHIEPQANNLSVRFRIEGILRDSVTVPKYIQEALISRVKIIAGLDIAEKRAPQDGRISIKIHDKDVDLRVSTLPTVYGEKVVIRVLNKTNLPLNLLQLDLDEKTYFTINSFLQNTKGIVLVTGPTGSGKTTTLYAAVGQVRSRAKNIVTVEDPVEYTMDGISQVQVNEKAGVTFASGLRSILRQDPDVILIGEIRDKETAQIALEAALTGRLVLSTLHTNSAPGAIIRLIELGIQPYLVAEALVGIVAQRLVRKLCENCKVTYNPDREILDKVGLIEKDINDKKIYKAVGCSLCGRSGYKNRIPIFEILKAEQQVKKQITDKISENSLINIGKMSGMNTLKEDGIAKVFQGVTTFEEVIRVAYQEKETTFSCPRCNKTLEASFTICPYCQQDLNLKICKGCSRQLNPLWEICPYCRTSTKG
jgi:type IV pilus assembly protein PilB